MVSARAEYFPDALKEGCAEGVDDFGFSLANPGEEWQATDDLAERGLPRRRLIFAGIAEGWGTFVHYEIGGPEHKYGVVVLHMDGDYARLDWGGVGSKPAKNLEELRQMIGNGEFSDEIPNSW